MLLSPRRPKKATLKSEVRQERLSCVLLRWSLEVSRLGAGLQDGPRGRALTLRGDSTSQHTSPALTHHRLCPTKEASSASSRAALTRLSSIRMRASNSCSPISHLGGDPVPSPAGDPGDRDLALYFPGSRSTKLSGPPALARVRTFSKTNEHYNLSFLLTATGLAITRDLVNRNV